MSFNPDRLGIWNSPPYVSTDYTASGPMRWTVDAGDVTTYQYTMFGKTMIVNFALVNTTVGGTGGSSYLLLKIPAGKIAATPTGAFCSIFNAGASPLGWCFVNNGLVANNIAVQRLDGADFTLETNACNTIGQIIFETTT